MDCLFYSWRSTWNVGPRREGAHIKHGVSPGVNAQINGQYPDHVQYGTGFHLE